MKIELHGLAIRIFQLCACNSIYLDIQWIPRTKIESADYISRFIDVDDWQLTDSCFLAINETWGPHTIDCFANFYNKKLPRFYSRFWNSECHGVDFFVSKICKEKTAWSLPLLVKLEERLTIYTSTKPLAPW